MAKTSAIQKNLKRIKLEKKYAKKRAALKKIIKNKKLELAERFAAQLKLNKLPKNSSKISYGSFNLPIGPHVSMENLKYIVYNLRKITERYQK
mgnify:CR=1 FL=1